MLFWTSQTQFKPSQKKRKRTLIDYKGMVKNKKRTMSESENDPDLGHL